MSGIDLSKQPWHSLSPQEKSERLLAIQVLRRLRNGEPFSFIVKDLGVSPALLRKHACCYIQDRDLRG
jgi:hypothetical protein